MLCCTSTQLASYLFNGNEKDARLTSLPLLCCHYGSLGTDFSHCFFVSVIDFELVNADGEKILRTLERLS